MRILLWMSRVLIAIAVAWVFVAWYQVWAEHRKEVERVRFVWGPNADIPSFNPLDLFNFARMKYWRQRHECLRFRGPIGILGLSVSAVSVAIRQSQEGIDFVTRVIEDEPGRFIRPSP